MQVHLINNIGFILLAIYLIVSGAISLLRIGNRTIQIIRAIITIASGIFILLGY